MTSNMKNILLILISFGVMIGLNSCDKFSLKKKTPEYREKLQGFYTARIVDERFSAFPDPPSGILSDVTREIKVEKSDEDSTILIDGMKFKVNTDYVYDKTDDNTPVGVGSYNFTHFEFFSRNKNDSLFYLKSQGTASLYTTRKMSAAYNRGL